MASQQWVCNDGGCRVVFTQNTAHALEESFQEINAPKAVFLLCGESSRSQSVASVVSEGLKGAYDITTIPKCGNNVSVAQVDDILSSLPTDDSSFILLAVGGGGAIGVAKALSLRYASGVRIACVPTTYSGSEMTNIVGITGADGKKTIRDPRNRPSVVVYDPTLAQTMSRDFALKSAFNALAHAVEALWDDASAGPTSLLLAESAAKTLMTALQKILKGQEEFNSPSSCYSLLYGAHLCGSVLQSNKMGIHHKLAHIAGGTFGLEHSAAHTVLLPHSIAFNQNHVSDACMAALGRTIGGGRKEVAGKLWDLMQQLGLPTSLHSLGFKSKDLERAARTAVEQASVGPYALEAEYQPLYDLFHCAHHGRRPSSRISHDASVLAALAGARASSGLSHSTMPVSISGASLDNADVAVICVHGRFSSADRIIQQWEEIVGEQYEGHRVALVAPQALDQTWYPGSFLLSLQENEPTFSETMDVIDHCVQHVCKHVPPSRVVLFGLSQGACSIISYAARQKSRSFAGIVALSGGLCGTDADVSSGATYSSEHLKGCKVFLGCAEADSHVPKARVEASAKLLGQHAAVTCEIFAGNERKIFPSTASKARCFFMELVASVVGASGHDSFQYIAGYQSLLESEALPGAVPPNQRSPAHVPYGLVAEVITGSSFVAPRAASLTTWFYRIHPTIGTHGEFQPMPQDTLRGDFCCPGHSITPEPVRWKTPPHPKDSAEPCDWVEGLTTIAGTGNPFSVKGVAIHRYSCNKDMIDRSFYNSDGDLLVVPELGTLLVQTEFGFLRVKPGEIFILPRGLKMTITLESGYARGFVSELFEQSHFQLPNLGPIGTNGLADARHFKVPTACYENRSCKDYELISKFGGKLYIAPLQYSPYDVVGWSGRYHPCKYDLLNFMAYGSVTYDHADPSIHTVLGCPIDTTSGASACDFVCFRSRLDAVQHTFRPPWYHRNIATEFNAIIEINAPYNGFDKGVCWLTPCMTGHGIAGASYNGFMANGASDDSPTRISEGSIWIMFESIYPMVLTDTARNSPLRDKDYRQFFSGVPRTFTGPATGGSSSHKRKELEQDKR
mmetsp:Transcript_807/g.1656  ORF Transcript_807/g.1656 Transcript_807/m.1656 type:complete len:1075 (-) Transcript_807:105-3329(-)|eukprot:CAMPEP_0172324946 /NCGR_PEP_ID=MMETSP1058-20130122/52711_1 /TAXON_ID=83371 /ORGANISM="Detonula confervacea, Strain CCMP 353" /LENGTH=1074 /DNA_ID=CAMNT_0013041369 /DNA_START=185 /DNA_END=3409 /DNA_ORIENTATION=+